MIAEITPGSFQASALEWIGVATVLVGALSGFFALIIAKVAQMKSDAATKQGLADHATNKADISALQGAVTTIALQTPPPTSEPGEPQQVIVANPKSDPVPTIEEKKKPTVVKVTRRIK